MNNHGIGCVLMTADTVGGVWTYAVELAAALGNTGVEVVLATLGAVPSPGQVAEAMRIPHLQLLPSEYKLEWMDDPWRDVEASGEWLRGLEEHYGPDVVHLNSFGHGALAWRAPVILTAHSCVLSWWEAVKGEAPPPIWNRYRHEVEFSLRSVDAVIAPSAAMLRSIELHYGPALPPCHIVPNGRSAALFRPSPKDPFVLTAGRLWDQSKNAGAVGHVASQLAWPVYVAGDSRHPNGKEAAFPACRMLGRLPAGELAEWYRRASIYALPARYEPFGLSILEAALAGCALVLGDIRSLREIWDGAAIFVPPDDEASLRDAISGLIADEATRQTLAQRSIARARTFTPERMAQAYLDVYQSAMHLRSTACAS